MSGFDDKFDRIKKATGLRTQVELAELFDIRQSSISDAKKRDTIPSGWYVTLVRKKGINPEWIDTGMGPKHLVPMENAYDALEGDTGFASGGEEGAAYQGRISRIACRDVTVLSVAGGDSPDGEWTGAPMETLGIPRPFELNSLTVVKMEGSAMEPIILQDAYVGMDSSKNDLLSGEMYGVKLPYGGLVIRRVLLDVANGQVILRAENKSHSDQMLPLDKIKERTVGRVVWVMQKL